MNQMEQVKTQTKVSYNESVHMRLSKDQKQALDQLAKRHKISMSTALRVMIEHCLNNPSMMSVVNKPTTEQKGDVMDGTI